MVVRRLPLLSLTILLVGSEQLQAQYFSTSEFVRVGGIEQWISTRGSNYYNPVILIVHGGPGFSNAAHTHAFDSWQSEFTIVDWDQRGSGRTFMRNGRENSGELSVDRIAQDGIELARYLGDRFEQENIIVLGLSFGSIIALKMVSAEPSYFSAYVGSGQLVNRADGDALGYQETLREARRTDNGEAIEALEEMGPPPWPDAATWNAAKGWAGRMTRPEDPASRIRLNAMMQDLLDEGYSPEELEGIIEGARFTVSEMAPHTTTFDARQFASRLEVPVYVFQGENDLNTATGLAVEWFHSVDAPKKALRIVQGGSHGAFYANAEEFLAFLTEVVGVPTR